MSMTHGGSSSADATPEQKRRPSFGWRRVLLGVAVVAVMAAAWRSVYQANQRELFARRRQQQDRILAAALAEVPGRRFSVTDVNPEVLRKNALVE
ncbi:hypothetical protein DQ04_08171000 [Trypanosoma grayi]|uniref:hypothetical protein n=1 Tax=Trypanosoma grayi TaxID=71804 RepID=UPI0004F3FA3F|nr:hypothetical protein DQ04_08171000 [Trypanosoma grayi]KEG08033.1 hypothetical protein DQ04_08171000 [Trypanosoma grayi]